MLPVALLISALKNQINEVVPTIILFYRSGNSGLKVKKLVSGFTAT